MALFKEDFSLPDMGWLSSQIVDPNRIVAQSAVIRVPNALALKITLQPGDNPIGSTGERNEFLWMMNKNNNDVDGNTAPECIAFSIMLPQDWKDPSVWCTPFQLHAPNNVPSNQSSPSFELDMSSGRWILNTRGGDSSNVIRRQVDLGPQLLGQWTDFLFKINWGIGTDGCITIYRRDKKIGNLILVANAGTPNLYSAGGVALPHYFKSGCYSNAEMFTRQFYRSRIVRASTFEEAAYLAFWQ